MTTGDVSGAGTDANVFLSLFGADGDTGERRLSADNAADATDAAAGVKNRFERNQTDKFFVKAADLGELKKLRIWHDSAGLGESEGMDRWTVVKVVIVDNCFRNRRFVSFDIRDYSPNSAQCHILADIINEQFIDLMSYFSDVLFNFQMKMEMVNIPIMRRFVPRWELFLRPMKHLDSMYEQEKIN